MITPQGWELPWDDPAVADELSVALGQARVRLVRNPVGVHDVAPVHIISTGSLAAAREWVDGEDIDRRRFRANIILDLEEAGAVRRGRLGGRGASSSATGGPLLEVFSPTERCVMTTFDPDTVAPRQPGARGAGPGARQPVRRLRPREPRRLGRGGCDGADPLDLTRDPPTLHNPPRGGAVW